MRLTNGSAPGGEWLATEQLVALHVRRGDKKDLGAKARAGAPCLLLVSIASLLAPSAEIPIVDGGSTRFHSVGGFTRVTSTRPGLGAHHSLGAYSHRLGFTHPRSLSPHAHVLPGEGRAFLRRNVCRRSEAGVSARRGGTRHESPTPSCHHGIITSSVVRQFRFQPPLTHDICRHKPTNNVRHASSHAAGCEQAAC